MILDFRIISKNPNVGKGLILVKTGKNDTYLKSLMEDHYSKPKGFVGRQIIYRVYYDKILYGAIAGGSATLNLPGRKSFIGNKKLYLENIVNNTFYHINKQNKVYPKRNFTTFVLKEFRKRISEDYYLIYKDEVMMFETLVELPRSGSLYLKDGWEKIGETKGFTCKRVAGLGTDSWSGKRVWNTSELRRKLVFAKFN